MLICWVIYYFNLFYIDHIVHLLYNDPFKGTFFAIYSPLVQELPGFRLCVDKKSSAADAGAGSIAIFHLQEG